MTSPKTSFKRARATTGKRAVISEEPRVEEHPHHARLRRLRDHPRAQGGDGEARWYRPHGAQRYGFDDAALALSAQPRLRHGRDLGVVLHRRPRAGLAG